MPAPFSFPSDPHQLADFVVVQLPSHPLSWKEYANALKFVRQAALPSFKLIHEKLGTVFRAGLLSVKITSAQAALYFIALCSLASHECPLALLLMLDRQQLKVARKYPVAFSDAKTVFSFFDASSMERFLCLLDFLYLQLDQSLVLEWLSECKAKLPFRPLDDSHFEYNFHPNLASYLEKAEPSHLANALDRLLYRNTSVLVFLLLHLYQQQPIVSDFFTRNLDVLLRSEDQAVAVLFKKCNISEHFLFALKPLISIDESLLSSSLVKSNSLSFYIIRQVLYDSAAFSSELVAKSLKNEALLIEVLKANTQKSRDILQKLTWPSNYMRFCIDAQTSRLGKVQRFSNLADLPLNIYVRHGILPALDLENLNADQLKTLCQELIYHFDYLYQGTQAIIKQHLCTFPPVVVRVIIDNLDDKKANWIKHFDLPCSSVNHLRLSLLCKFPLCFDLEPLVLFSFLKSLPLSLARNFPKYAILPHKPKIEAFLVEVILATVDSLIAGSATGAEASSSKKDRPRISSSISPSKTKADLLSQLEFIFNVFPGILAESSLFIPAIWKMLSHYHLFSSLLFEIAKGSVKKGYGAHLLSSFEQSIAGWDCSISAIPLLIHRVIKNAYDDDIKKLASLLRSYEGELDAEMLFPLMRATFEPSHADFRLPLIHDIVRLIRIPAHSSVQDWLNRYILDSSSIKRLASVSILQKFPPTRENLLRIAVLAEAGDEASVIAGSFFSSANFEDLVLLYSDENLADSICQALNASIAKAWSGLDDFACIEAFKAMYAACLSRRLPKIVRGAGQEADLTQKRRCSLVHCLAQRNFTDRGIEEFLKWSFHELLLDPSEPVRDSVFNVGSLSLSFFRPAKKMSVENTRVY